MLPTSDLPSPESLTPESVSTLSVPPEKVMPEEGIIQQQPVDASPLASTDDPSLAASSGAAPAAAPPAMSPAACSAQLKVLFPALFTGVAKPLKLRIQADIQARVPGLFTKPLLSVVLRRYTGSHSYLVALTQATHRFDLDGAPAGELSAEHKQAAMDELTLRRTTQRDAQREVQKAAQKAAQNDNQRKLQQDQREAQQQQALEEQKRRNRATLLRDFENTTLTPANFSVLKGITVEAMEGYLATARQEAQALRAAQPEMPRSVMPRSAPLDATRQRQPEPWGDRSRADGRPGQAPRGPRR